MATAPWRFAAASAIGTSHAGTDTPCQDSAVYRVIDTPAGDVLMVVVCDGAGSAAYSEVGSSIAVSRFADLAEAFFGEGAQPSNLSRDIASAWCETVAQELEATAGTAGHAVRDYACTLLAAMIGKSGSAFIQIGDGAMVVSEGVEDGWSWVFWPQHGEFANTTNFVISANAADVMEFATTINRIEEIAVFSDGIENLVLHHATKTVHSPFFETMMAPVRKADAGLSVGLSKSLEEYLLSPRICDRTDDDKTLVLATRRAATALDIACGSHA